MAKRPLLAASLGFVGGTAIGAWLPQEPTAWGCAAAATLALWAVLLALGSASAAGGAGCVAFIVIGIFRCQADLTELYAGTPRLEEGEAVVAGRVSRPPEERDGSLRMHLEEVRLRRVGETVRLDGALQVAVAGGAAGYAAGDLVTVRGSVRPLRGDRNLGWFPGPVVQRGRRVLGLLAVSSPAWVRIDGSDRGEGPRAAVLRWRAAADRFWKARSGAAGGILNALTTGERADIPAEVQQDFLRSGLTHLLAISGMNVGFLAALVFLLLRRALALCEEIALRCPAQLPAAALTLPALWFFMLFSGSQIPVGRAVLMSAAGMVAIILWRRAVPADALALAAVILVALDPRILFTPSFQLSFAAVAALLLVASRLRMEQEPAREGGPVPALRRGARALFLASLAASAATAPIVAFAFQQVSLVGPPANLVAVPYTGFIVLPAAWLTLAAAALWAPAGDAMARLAVLSADGLIAIAAWCGAPPWAALRTARPSLLLALCLLALACSLLPRPTPQLRWLAVGACAGAAVVASAGAIAAHAWRLHVAVFDVGQGLAAAILIPGRRSLLYDAGPRWREYDAGERVVVPALRRLGVRRLDALLISHAHPDHEGGADAVRRELGEKGKSGATFAPTASGCESRLGGEISLRLLHREADQAAAAGRDENDRSLALLVSYGETGMVFTGDAGPAPLGSVVAAARPLPPRLALQVPHHGGSPEACRVLAESLRPEISAISVGRNGYGHPRPEAVTALEQHGRVLRTDRDGAIFIRSDGRHFEVRTWRELATARTWSERVRWLVAGW